MPTKVHNGVCSGCGAYGHFYGADCPRYASDRGSALSDESILREAKVRRIWSEEVQYLVREQAQSENPHLAAWPDIKDYYLDGYSPRDAARKYLSAYHLGEAS